MGFSRIPLWDKHLSLAGFKIGASDGLDDALGARASLWSGMDMIGVSSMRLPKHASASVAVWALSESLWSQAAEMADKHSDSFEQWCRHVRDCSLIIASPARAMQDLPGPSLELAAKLAERGVPLWNQGFCLTPSRIGLSSKSAGVFLSLDALGSDLCGLLSTKFSAAGKCASIERVSSHADVGALREAGCASMMSGEALWAPDSHVGARRFEPTTARLLEALAIAFDDGDLDKIETAIKSDVALAFKFISLLNSAAHRQESQGVGSVRQGIMMLGRQQLIQWLSMLLLRVGQQKPEQTALRWAIGARARLAENLAAQGFDPTLRSRAFVCATFTGLPAALGVSFDELLSECPLPPDLVEAISSGAGPLGKIVSLALDSEAEGGLEGRHRATLAQIGVDPAKATDLRREAFQWACSTL